MSKKYRVQFPTVTVGGKDHKLNGPLVLSDVYIRDESDRAVVTMNPVVVGEGYLDVDRFERDDWNASLNGGIIRDLIEQGVVIVEDSDAPSKKSTKAKGSVAVADVSEPVVPVKVADVTEGIVKIESLFSQKKYNEKIAYVKACKDVAELQLLLDKENLGSHIKTVVKKQIEKLSK